MSKKSYPQLKSLFEKKGFKFRNFTLSFIGDYLPDDADWNYKDIRHLNIVHKTLYGIQAINTRDVMCNINLQKIPVLGIEIPMTLFQYDAKKNNPIYISTLGPYVIIVNTIFDINEKNQTKISTLFQLAQKAYLEYFILQLKKF